MCRLGITDPVPEDLDRYYGDGYHGGRHGFTAKMCDARRRQIVTQQTGGSTSKRLLDVGCGDGTFLRTMIDGGWQASGVEKYPGPARMDDVTMHESLEQAATSAPYDCITLWHVLEHLPDPSGTIASLRSLLAPGGILIIAVPDFGNFVAKRFAASWLHLDVPRHHVHFTRHSLAGLLVKHDFITKLLWRSELEYDLMGLAQSVLNAWGAEPNAFMKRLTGRPTRTRGWKLTSQGLLGGMICGLGVVPLWLCGRLGRGGTLIIVGRVNASGVEGKN